MIKQSTYIVKLFDIYLSQSIQYILTYSNSWKR